MKENLKKGTTFVEIEGDVFEEFFNSSGNAIFMHGANCHKVMGAGVAAQVATKMAPLYYLDRYDTRTTSQRFGNYGAVVLLETEKVVKIGVNLYTQFLPGPNFELSALVNSLRSLKLNLDLNTGNRFTVYIPQIGCGIGGGDWKEVLPVLKRELADFNVVAVKYKAKK